MLSKGLLKSIMNNNGKINDIECINDIEKRLMLSKGLLKSIMNNNGKINLTTPKHGYIH